MRTAPPSSSTPGAVTTPPRPEREVELHNQWTREMERALGGARASLEQGIEGLGDEELMMLVGQYTRQIDIEIRQHMIGMRSRANDSRNYAAVMEEVQRQVSHAPDRNATQIDLDADVRVIDAQGNETTMKLGPLMDSLGIKRPVAGAKLSTDVVEAIKLAVNKNTEEIRAKSEQGQLELQQIMSRRSQMLQITSNIMASRNESRKSIAQNIRG